MSRRDPLSPNDANHRTKHPRSRYVENVSAAAAAAAFLFLYPPHTIALVTFVKNLRIYATLVSGVQLELSDCPTGRNLVSALLRSTDEPAKALVIEATDKEGRVVRIVVHGDDSEVAKVSIGTDT